MFSVNIADHTNKWTNKLQILPHGPGLITKIQQKGSYGWRIVLSYADRTTKWDSLGKILGILQ